MVILGLDLSTSITGATLLDEEGNTLLCEAWDTRNKKQFPTLFHKAHFVRNKLLGLGWPVKKIFIEQSLQSFRSGFSSAQTLSTLSRFNGIISWICFSDLNRIPEYIAAPSARKLCELKVPRGTKAKEVALQFFLDNGNEIEYTSHGNPKPGSYDRADSWVIAKAGYKLWKEGLRS
jgi:hypothetical protein